MTQVRVEYGVIQDGTGMVALTATEDNAFAIAGILRELLPEASLAVSSYATSVVRKYSRLIDLDRMIAREEHWISWWSGEVIHWVQDLQMRKKSIRRLELWERVKALAL